jgi:hypothetical protein
MAAHTANPVGQIMDQDKVEGPARIMIQAEVLSLYFTPLLEGLALFSEFDALSGASPVASTVSSIALSIFCKASVRAAAATGNNIAPYDSLRFYIGKHRAQTDAAERKLALLSRPLSADDGYLIGYLWVKALWRILVSRCRKLLDTDLFMSFVIDYFFGDFRLATLLFRLEDALRTDASLETYVSAIEYYVFGQRLNDLVENADELVWQYERYATKLRPGHLSTARDDTTHAPYHNYSEDVAAGIEMSLAYSSIRSMHIMWPNFAAGRHILRLFVAPADVEIDEAGMFKAHCPGSEGLIEGSTLEVARPLSKERVSGVGSIEALLLPQTFRVLICVFLGHELIATIDALSGNITTLRQPRHVIGYRHIWRWRRLQSRSLTRYIFVVGVWQTKSIPSCEHEPRPSRTSSFRILHSGRTTVPRKTKISFAKWIKGELSSYSRNTPDRRSGWRDFLYPLEGESQRSRKQQPTGG